MNNRNVLITGMPGTGKTQLAKRLAMHAPRVVFLDPVADYTEDAEFETASLPEAIDFFLAHRRGNFALAFQGYEAREHLELMKLVVHAQRVEPQNGPLALFMEESHYFSTLHNLPPIVEKAFALGRRWRINAVSIIQRDTTISPTIRACTQLWVSTHQIKLSSDYKSIFDEDKVRRLTPLFPGDTAAQGTHFLVSPEYVNLFQEWERINNDEKE